MIDPTRDSPVPDQRLPLLDPEALSDQQHALYQAIAGGLRADRAPLLQIADVAGRLLGPFNAMLYSPEVGMPLQDLGAALRFRTGFARREREIAILVVAAHWRSDFEWYAHERLGRRAGLSDEVLDALRTGREPVLDDARERLVHRVAHELTTGHDLDDTLFAEAAATLGRAALVELITLVGYYAALALQLRALRVGVPDGEPAPRWDRDPR